jgi:hypothetical protein
MKPRTNTKQLTLDDWKVVRKPRVPEKRTLAKAMQTVTGRPTLFSFEKITSGVTIPNRVLSVRFKRGVKRAVVRLHLDNETLKALTDEEREHYLKDLRQPGNKKTQIINVFFFPKEEGSIRVKHGTMPGIGKMVPYNLERGLTLVDQRPLKSPKVSAGDMGDAVAMMCIKNGVKNIYLQGAFLTKMPLDYITRWGGCLAKFATAAERHGVKVYLSGERVLIVKPDVVKFELGGRMHVRPFFTFKQGKFEQMRLKPH